jgi:hypothetical protein
MSEQDWVNAVMWGLMGLFVIWVFWFYFTDQHTDVDE